MKAARRGNKQVAALPIWVTADGTAEIMLITSRETRRWIIPKGWPMKGRTAAAAALTEAFEEAGIEGEMVGRKPISTYRYLKVRLSGERDPIKVDVFSMLVTAQLQHWPEQDQRETGWFTATEAAAMVAEPALAKCIRRVPAMIRRKAFVAARLVLLK